MTYEIPKRLTDELAACESKLAGFPMVEIIPEKDRASIGMARQMAYNATVTRRDAVAARIERFRDIVEAVEIVVGRKRGDPDKVTPVRPCSECSKVSWCCGHQCDSFVDDDD